MSVTLVDSSLGGQDILGAMSDTTEMVNLMEHAADLLSTSIAQLGRWTGGDAALQTDRTSAIAAAAYARGVLQMTVASVRPEHTNLAAALQADYQAWAEANNEIGMSDGELACIARFLARQHNS